MKIFSRLNSFQEIFVTRTDYFPLAARAIKTLGFSIFEGNCVLCQLPSERARDLCRLCEQSLRWLPLPCKFCALPPTTHNKNISDTHTNIFSGISVRNSANQRSIRVCAKCARQPQLLPITRTLAPLAYAGCARWLVQQQKHRRGAVHARILAELLGDTIAVHYSLEDRALLPDLLIPVPLHWRRELSRGHNQSVLLAASLARRFNIPMANNLVRRGTFTPSQQLLNRAERRANLVGAFSLNRGAAEKLHKRRVAIVDDVVTTGATSQTLARTLLKGGAAEVHLFAPTRAILTP